MKIALDVMGGDHAPEEVVAGAVDWARDHVDTDLILVGDEAAIRSHVQHPLPEHVRIVALLSDPTRRKNRSPRAYLLTGIVRCGLCDARLVARPRADKKRCYVCSTGPGFSGCGKIRSLAEPLEDLIVAAVLRAVPAVDLHRSDPVDDQTAAIAKMEGRLVELAQAFKPHLAQNASVVSIGISSLLVTPDNYGYMGPIKAALESCSRFLAKSFGATGTEIRCNIVGSGPLKTSASAGIPGYLESYLYAEKLTFRKRNLETQEVAKAYGAACTPDFFLYDKGRKLVYRGQLDASRPGNNVPVTGTDLRAALDALLAGRSMPEKQTPSIGCNIKWRDGNEPDYFDAAGVT